MQDTLDGQHSQFSSGQPGGKDQVPGGASERRHFAFRSPQFRGVGGRRTTGALAAVALLTGGTACLDRPIGTPPPVTTNIFVDTITQTSVDKIDLLFMIDNSKSMSDKQAILRAAVPDLVSRLVNPVCVDAAGVQQPAPAIDADCPTGQTREFNPIRDINIAVISSSMGDAGANDQCAANQRPDFVDLGRTVGSLARWRDTRDRGANEFGFLEWRAGTTDLDSFNTSFSTMVSAVNENGCGWEHSLESWYHFLIDPFPYRSLVRVPCSNDDMQNSCVSVEADAQGVIEVDEVLLAQRQAFLRDDSLVAIIMLTDENDCSIQVGRQSWVVAQVNSRFPMYRGSSACDSNPNDECCYNCELGAPDGCDDDPICAANPGGNPPSLENRLPLTADGGNLRCFDQKRRFGLDFLYPTDRYVNALTAPQLCWEKPDLDPADCPQPLRTNPLYRSGLRTRDLVFLGGIVGVPWQLIQSAEDANGRPVAANDLRFKTAAQLSVDDTWDEILGSRGTGTQTPVPPTSPYMVESAAPRAGVMAANDINGGEYDTTGNTPSQLDDLQYACTFPLPADARKVCDPTDTELCDCDRPNKPLCEPTRGGQRGTTQYFAKAYPGLRELQVLKDYGANSIVASICARNVDDPARPDFGYRPAISAIVDRLKEQLGDRCLPRGLLADPVTGTVPCSLVEVTFNQSNCRCDGNIARAEPSDTVSQVVLAQLRNRPEGCGVEDPNCDNACLCDVQQVQTWASSSGRDTAAALSTCQQDENASGVEGWCYISDTPDQQVGNPALVEDCPATQKRLLRFVGRGLQPNTITYVACSGASPGAATETPATSVSQ